MTLLEALVSNESASDTEEAKQIVNEMRNRVIDGEDPEDVLMDYGLEPDYVFEILEF